MEDRVKIEHFGRQSGKRKRLADLLVEAARAGKSIDKGVIETLQRKREVVDHIKGLKITHLSLDEGCNLHQHQIDALDYLNQSQAASRMSRPAIRQKTLDDFSDAELVMEMIKRGYAAMKLPSDGGPPETLR